MSTRLPSFEVPKKCPQCGEVWTRHDPDSTSYCDRCNNFMLHYKPLPHQVRFHADPAKYKMFAGGYGSGKTRTSVQEIIRHVIETPGGRTLMGAPTYQALIQTSQAMFLEQFPPEMIEDFNKSLGVLKAYNGHEVLFRAVDDQGKLRSLNLTAFHLEEASEIKYNIFDQLKTRLRHAATKKHIGILSTNPDDGWVKTEFLLKSKIYDPMNINRFVQEEIYDDYVTHISASELNWFLPEGFVEGLRATNPDWWVRRFIDGSFENREGLIFPQFKERIVDWDVSEINKRDPIRWGTDFGIKDPTATLWVQVDKDRGKLHVFDEYYVSQQSVSTHAAEFNNRNMTFSPYQVMAPVGDAAGKRRSNDDMNSTFDNYAEYGIYYRGSTKKLMDSIQKLYNYFDSGRLVINSNCKKLLWELEQYKWKKPKDGGDYKEEPIDLNNHLIDVLRYIVFELPDDPSELDNPNHAVYSGAWLPDSTDHHLPFALQDDSASFTDDYMYY